MYTGALKRYPLPGGIVARSIQRTDTGWVASEPCALNTAEVLKAAFLLDSVGVSHGVNAHELLDRLVAEHIESADYQVVALTLWAASFARSSHAANLLRILPGRIPADASQSMPLAWALSAVCAYAESNDARDASEEFARRLADRLLTNQDSSSGLFYSSARRVGLLRRRNADATLSTQTYPILALSHYARVFEMPAVLPFAQSCADRLCALQGAEGQWWRRYDPRRGRVLQDYPVYAVNQDAALPAALGALQRALGDRRYEGPIGRGLQWECGSNEVRKTLVDADDRIRGAIARQAWRLVSAVVGDVRVSAGPVPVCACQRSAVVSGVDHVKPTLAGRRALVVAFCFPPHAAIGTHRTIRLVTHLASHGWHVDVLTVAPDTFLAGTPTDPDLLRSIPTTARVVRARALRGLSTLGRWVEPLKRAVRRAPEPAAAAPPAHAEKGAAGQRPGVKTLLEELCAMPDKEIGWFLPAILVGTKAFWKTPPDVIFSSAPPWTTHLVAKALAGILGTRWVADFRDPWVRSPWTRYRTGVASAWAARLEAGAVRSADAVLFTTDSARREFAAHYSDLAGTRFRTVPNGCDPSELPADEAGPSDKFVLLHAGSLYGGRSPVPLLHAVGSLCRRDAQAASRLRVRFLGSTGFPGVDIEALCREMGIGDVVEFLPRVDRRQSLREMRRASALLLLQAGTAMAIPGKLYEYLAVGRPVLALCEAGEMSQMIQDHRVGLVVPGLDEPAIEQALAELLAGPQERWQPAPPSLFDGRLRAAEMATVLETVLPNRPEQICVA